MNDIDWRRVIGCKFLRAAHLGSILHPEEWPGEGRFIDLHTLGRALRDQSYTLKRACEEFAQDGSHANRSRHVRGD